MRLKPSSCTGNRHVKRRERKMVNGDLTDFYGWNESQILPTGDFHEVELTKKTERNLIKTI